MSKFAHSIAAVTRNTLRLDDNLLREDLPIDMQSKLFKRYVEEIEVETTSYCNRRCRFCPNSFIDRRSEKNTMPDEVWQSILRGLNHLNYNGVFSWSRYSEPLSQPDIFDRIKAVKTAAPNCRIKINTNGDFLRKDTIEKLGACGVDYLFIDIYVNDDDEYTAEVVTHYMKKLFKRIGKEVTPPVETSPEFSFRIKDHEPSCVAIARNSSSLLQAEMSNRGGLIASSRVKTRQSPCFAPIKHLVIDWNGSVVPCCQMRSDAPEHATHVTSNLFETDLPGAYQSLYAWRQQLVGFGDKSSPCNLCNIGEYQANAVTRSISSVLLSRYGRGIRTFGSQWLPKNKRAV